MIHYKFPHIEQLKNVLVSLKHKYQNPVQTSDGWVFDESLPLPVIEFYGTVKLHGSNTAIVVDMKNDMIYAQSRESILTPQSDYKEFAKFVEEIGKDTIVDMLSHGIIGELYTTDEPIVIYGEWCGQGIQSGVGISQLPRMFVIFAVKIGNRWCDKNEFCNMQIPDKKIYNIFKGANNGDPSTPALFYNTVIDFNNLSTITDALSEVTEDVERECPFAKTFGISGIGEGIVWRSICDYRTKKFCGGDDGDPWMFKVKGDKHKNVKEKSLITIAPEVTDNINQIVSSVLTEQRLNQGIEKLGEKGLEVSKKNTSNFLMWIKDDITRECRDILDPLPTENCKAVFADIQKKAREWFFKQPGV